MNIVKRAIAAAELLLVLPAAVFMTALFVRNITPVQLEPAHSAQRIVAWYAGLPVHVGLWGLLILLPLAALVGGGATLRGSWTADAELRQAARQVLAACRTHLATLLIAVATLMAFGVLAVVAVHVLTD